jgi:hypothetical protein
MSGICLPRLSSRVLQVIAMGCGQTVACALVGGKGLERGMAYSGLRRVGEEQLVVPRLKAPVREATHEVAKGVLNGVPECVDDDRGDADWRRCEAVHP